MNIMNDLEQLLSQPMAEIVDQGFSDKIINDIINFNQKRTWLLTIVSMASALLFLVVFPVQQWLIMAKSLFVGESITTNSFSLAELATLSQQLSQPVFLMIITICIIFFVTRIES